MVNVVLTITPVQSLPIQIGNVAKYAIRKKIILNKAYEPLNLAFCKRMTRLTKLCTENLQSS